MAEFKGGHATVLATALLLAGAIPSWGAPAPEDLVGNYAVNLAEAWPFDGRVEATTFDCPRKGSCVSTLRVELRGKTYTYFAFASATATSVTIRFSGRTNDDPELATETGDRIDILRDVDGAGSQVATLIVSGTGSHWYTTKPFTLRETLPARLPIAKVRVTVRHRGAEQPNR